jgi:acyl-CoA synthetase (AMP-forming)/AMP-acid ligase II
LVEHWHLVQRAFELTPRDRMLIAGPFYHSRALLFGLTGLFAGGHVTIHGAFDPKRVLVTIAEERITLAPMVPTMYTVILAEDVEGFDVSSMRAVISAGSPLLTDTKDRLLRAFPDAGLYEFYGSTEVGIVSVLGPEDQRRKHRSVGLPPVGVSVRTVDGAGEPVPAGTPGEVEKRGLLLGGGYYRNDEATAGMYDGNWARTGDIGVIDDEGYLSIVDRMKDMIITGGANVSPAEIEEVIARHPGVLEVAVIGVPDDRWGEAVKAVVVPWPGATVTEVDILNVCAGELAGFKRPRSVDFVEALPKTGSGKVLKRQLREPYWAGQSVQVH